MWLLAWLDVTTSIRDRDTNLGPVVRSTVWWPNKRPARVQLAKILASLISVTFPIATGVRCYCPIVQSSLNPLVLSDNHFQSPHFVPPPPAFHVLPQFSPIYTAVGFRVWFLWKRQRDLAKSDFWFGEIHSPLENRCRLAVPLPPPSLPPTSAPWI